jgi:hypothetical protein
MENQEYFFKIKYSKNVKSRFFKGISTNVLLKNNRQN